MAYTEEHLLLQWTAKYRQGATDEDPAYEDAVGALRFAGTAGPLALQETCDALAQVLASYWTNEASLIPRNCYLTTVKFNPIGTDGRYSRDSETILTEVENTSGSRSNVYPTQIAWATTWDTGANRGRAKSGRTFWPTAVPVDPYRATVVPPYSQNKANWDLQLIDNLNAVFVDGQGAGLRAVVMSNIGAGTTRPIIGTRVGARLDIQRRRAGNMLENYVYGLRD